MNAHDVLKYGHLWVHKHLDGLSEEQCLATGVCGVWLVKDIVAHLASFEWVLVDVLTACAKAGPTPNLDHYTSMDGDAFNAEQVGKRREKTTEEIVQEYDNGYEMVMIALRLLSENDLRQPATIPWYGQEYAIDDFIVYQYYGHKREHCAQIAAFRDQFK